MKCSWEFRSIPKCYCWNGARRLFNQTRYPPVWYQSPITIVR